MARTFIQEIFNQTITTTDVYSSGQLYEMLGRPDQLAVQILVDSVSTGTPTVTAVLQHSNDGADNTFETLISVTSAAITTSGTFFVQTATLGTTLVTGGFVRLKIKISAGTGMVRAIAVGRDR